MPSDIQAFSPKTIRHKNQEIEVVTRRVRKSRNPTSTKGAMDRNIFAPLDLAKVSSPVEGTDT